MLGHRGLVSAVAAGVAAGCGADLLDGEVVVPGEVAAVSYRGAAGAELGAGVALAGQDLLAGAPGSGEVWSFPDGWVCAGLPGLGRAVWWAAGERFAAQPGTGVYRVEGSQAELVWEAREARFFAAGETMSGTWVAGSSGNVTWLWDDAGALVARLVLGGVQRLAIGRERVLLLACADEGCRAWAWWPGDGAVEDLGAAGDGGALTEVDGVAWWGDPDLEDPLAPGAACSEGGICIVGIEGDHLGRSLCPGHAAGVFNAHAVPGRLRLVPLAGGTVLAVDRGTPGRPPTLDCRDGALAVGLPSAGLAAPGEGIVMRIDLDDVP